MILLKLQSEVLLLKSKGHIVILPNSSSVQTSPLLSYGRPFFLVDFAKANTLELLQNHPDFIKPTVIPKIHQIV